MRITPRLQRASKPALAIAAVALLAAACGGGSSGAATTQSGAPQQGQGTGAQTPPGAFGEIAEISGASMQVQSQAVGQVEVRYTGTTTFTQTVAASASALTAGMCVNAQGAADSGTTTSSPSNTVTAATVTISTPTASGCMNTNGFGGGQRGGTQGSPRPQPSGATRGPGNAAFGKVTAVNGSSFTVSMTRGPASGSASTALTTRTVLTNGSTTFRKTVAATKSSLQVGRCVAALGTANSTGVVTARSIAVSQPTAAGCSAGMGRGGLSGQGATGAGGGSGA
jgi:hypothetical protein